MSYRHSDIRLQLHQEVKEVLQEGESGHLFTLQAALVWKGRLTPQPDEGHAEQTR